MATTAPIAGMPGMGPFQSSPYHRRAARLLVPRMNLTKRRARPWHQPCRGRPTVGGPEAASRIYYVGTPRVVFALPKFFQNFGPWSLRELSVGPLVFPSTNSEN